MFEFLKNKKNEKIEKKIKILEDKIFEMEIRYIEEISDVRKIALKRENYAWELREEEVVLIQDGKKFKKIRKILCDN